MKIQIIYLSLLVAGAFLAQAQNTLESTPPVVIRTSPIAGDAAVDPNTTEIRVTFSKEMLDQAWSWCMINKDTYPETTGNPSYLADQRTCRLPVKLEPGKLYAIWLNTQQFQNFKDRQQQPALPYLLSFQTAPASLAGPIAHDELLNEDQKLIRDWTDRQFRGFFDNRTFAGLSEEERTKLETRLIDTLKGPRNSEYYTAINSLAAMKSKAAVPGLLRIAAERVEKDNRDRWMAVRALGLIGEKSAVPDLIHLTYHGNSNTRWWAQLSLVRLTGQNFGNDWKRWGDWWSSTGSQPPFNPDFVVWYADSKWNEPQAAAASVKEFDENWLNQLRGKK